jgi:hypothetical protein
MRVPSIPDIADAPTVKEMPYRSPRRPQSAYLCDQELVFLRSPGRRSEFGGKRRAPAAVALLSCSTLEAIGD